MPFLESIENPPYLSKSDFKVARTCPTKLFYKKSGYPTNLDGDAYMELLADGGFMVGKLAQLRFPEGVPIPTLDPWRAIEETRQLLRAENITLFEAAIYHDHRLVRIDILRKQGNQIELIEVKSKAADSSGCKSGSPFIGSRGGIRSEWREYLEDIAYQAMVLQAAIPQLQITCSLLVPDKAKQARLDGLCQRFRLCRRGSSVEVVARGTLDELRREDILTSFRVDAEVRSLAKGVEDASRLFVGSLTPELKKLPVQISYACRDCEYGVENTADKSGFSECWGSLGEENPHIFDLFQLRMAKGTDGKPVVDALIKRKKTSLFDVPISACSSAYGPRQKIQILQTRSGKEWFGPAMSARLTHLDWPLHFIDFETSTMALPYHRGMRPFELVAFQWSCHTLNFSGTEPTHQEWINVEQAYPNLEFARSLRNAVGDRGSLMTWSNHERTTLRTIADKIDAYFPAESDLAGWLRRVTTGNRIVDMCALAKDGYFHPEMKGSLSIKYVLPAIWRNNPELHDVPWFRKYAATKDGVVVNPYSTLPALPIGDKEELVNEGTGAMRAYQAMLYGDTVGDPKTKENWKRLLLQYCELDTMAMVVIFEHWRHRI